MDKKSIWFGLIAILMIGTVLAYNIDDDICEGVEWSNYAFNFSTLPDGHYIENATLSYEIVDNSYNPNINGTALHISASGNGSSHTYLQFSYPDLNWILPPYGADTVYFKFNVYNATMSPLEPVFAPDNPSFPFNPYWEILGHMGMNDYNGVPDLYLNVIWHTFPNYYDGGDFEVYGQLGNGDGSGGSYYCGVVELRWNGNWTLIDEKVCCQGDEREDCLAYLVNMTEVDRFLISLSYYPDTWGITNWTMDFVIDDLVFLEEENEYNAKPCAIPLDNISLLEDWKYKNYEYRNVYLDGVNVAPESYCEDRAFFLYMGLGDYDYGGMWLKDETSDRIMFTSNNYMKDIVLNNLPYDGACQYGKLLKVTGRLGVGDWAYPEYYSINNVDVEVIGNTQENYYDRTDMLESKNAVIISGDSYGITKVIGQSGEANGYYCYYREDENNRYRKDMLTGEIWITDLGIWGNTYYLNNSYNFTYCLMTFSARFPDGSIGNVNVWSNSEVSDYYRYPLGKEFIISGDYWKQSSDGGLTYPNGFDGGYADESPYSKSGSLRDGICNSLESNSKVLLFEQACVVEETLDDVDSGSITGASVVSSTSNPFVFIFNFFGGVFAWFASLFGF